MHSLVSWRLNSLLGIIIAFSDSSICENYMVIKFSLSCYYCYWFSNECFIIIKYLLLLLLSNKYKMLCKLLSNLYNWVSLLWCKYRVQPHIKPSFTWKQSYRVSFDWIPSLHIETKHRRETILQSIPWRITSLWEACNKWSVLNAFMQAVTTRARRGTAWGTGNARLAIDLG